MQALKEEYEQADEDEKQDPVDVLEKDWEHKGDNFPAEEKFNAQLGKNYPQHVSYNRLIFAKKENGTNAFNCIPYKNDCKNRVGIKHCLENGLLEQYHVLYSKDNLPVFTKKFTLIVGDDKCVLLRYKKK